jgi:hypothetical protein
VQSFRKHIHGLLELYRKYLRGAPLRPAVNQIILNLANLQEVLQRGLHVNAPDLEDTIYCTLSLNCFYRITGRGQTVLMHYIQPSMLELCDPKLEIHFTIEIMRSWEYHAPDLQLLLPCLQSILKDFNNPLLECGFPGSLNSSPDTINLDFSRILSCSRSRPFYKWREFLSKCSFSAQGTGIIKVLSRLCFDKYTVLCFDKHCSAQHQRWRSLHCPSTCYWGPKTVQIVIKFVSGSKRSFSWSHVFHISWGLQTEHKSTA